jgi:hypothetical protein
MEDGTFSAMACQNSEVVMLLGKDVHMVLKPTCQVPCISKNRLFTRVLRSRIGPGIEGRVMEGGGLSWNTISTLIYEYMYI